MENKEKWIHVNHDLTEKLGLVTIGVYLVLLTYAQGKLTCWPSLETLKAQTGLSVKSIRNHLSLLKDNGYIKIERGRTPDCSYDHNIYTFLKAWPEHYEQAANSFILNTDLDIGDRALAACALQYMKKTDDKGLMNINIADRAEIFKLDIRTLRAREKRLKEAKILTEEAPGKDMITRQNTPTLVYNLDIIKHAIIMVNDKIDQNENRIDNIEKDYVKKSDIEKYIEEYLHRKNIENVIDVDPEDIMVD